MKTVYVLGAGFSQDAGVPSQAQLLEKIIEVSAYYKEHFFQTKFKNLISALESDFHFTNSQIPEIPLEDILTPLDRCLMDNISFRRMNTDKMIQLKEDLYYLIGKTIDVAALKEINYIDKFADYLVSQCSVRTRDPDIKLKDPVSVISTNWDILLDKALKDKISEFNTKAVEKGHAKEGSLKNKGVVDYCCYMSSYDEHDHTIKPGLEAIGAGGFNVKLLKLHGSLNWLQCQRCSRVYISFDEKISLKHFSEPLECRHCKRNYGFDSSTRNLYSNLIMPTFLKSFMKAQYKLIWDNAGVELAEAERIIFVGYSLPHADFEMRQLMSRMVRADARIEVVTKGCPKNSGLKARYENFFGKRKVDWHVDGAKDYFLNLALS